MLCYKCIFIPLVVLLLLLTSVVLLLLGLRKWLQSQKAKLKKSFDNKVIVGIFHPYCNAAGGGERVLWCAIRALQAKYDNVQLLIYTGDTDASSKEILTKTKNLFNIDLDASSISFIFLKKRHWVEPKRYPYFTLLGQSIGSMILGMEALCKFPPDVYLDTTGFAFTLPLFRYLASCKVGCYVHYPTISNDMLRQVQKRVFSYNNQVYVARNPFVTWLKLIYYRLFANLYCWSGKCSDTIMVNSSFTENHIIDMWDVPFKTHRVYPPCEVSKIKALPKKLDSDKIIILSVAQFRPEKDHPVQLQALYELRTMLVNNETLWNKICLVMVGCCRNEEDYERLKNIQDLSKHLSLENNVEFRVNLSYPELLELYQKAKIGIHTMWNEHFGIGVVECMAAGIIMVAHRSGGPLLDIIETSEGSQTGYLALDAFDFASCILKIINSTDEENNSISEAARSSVDRFSENEFEVNFMRAVSTLFEPKT